MTHQVTSQPTRLEEDVTAVVRRRPLVAKRLSAPSSCKDSPLSSAGLQVAATGSFPPQRNELFSKSFCCEALKWIQSGLFIALLPPEIQINQVFFKGEMSFRELTHGGSALTGWRASRVESSLAVAFVIIWDGNNEPR